jgi:GT2 family glycosyltransferase/glycosyltransferase involved in cell wall biosynthesis
MPKRTLVDVVVPIRDDYEELEACLASVQRHGGDHRLILIDDASTDARVDELLQRLSADRTRKCVVLRNERSLGFVNTVNRGMTAGRNDVVLLDPGTRVTDGWLDRIARCAAADSTIGTVTPFSNDAESSSFLELDQDERIPDDPGLIGRAMEQAAVPVLVELPTASGSCIFVRRRLIERIGVLDPSLGEQHDRWLDCWVDFSKRARNAGFRNVLCDDAYVVIQGAGRTGVHEQRVTEAVPTRTLERHPEHAHSLREFIAGGPARPLRSMIESQLVVLAGKGKPGVLHVVHHRGGGTEKYIQELIEASRDDYRHHFLRILSERWVLTHADDVPARYEWPRDDGGSDRGWLRSICAWLRIDVVHVHSLVGSGDDFLRILEDASVPYCYTVHDMYVPCPTVYLINSEGDYCNATTDSALCRQCLSKCNGLEEVDIERWRERYRGFLANAARIYAPSNWARDTLERYYPGIEVTVAPPRSEVGHNEPEPGLPPALQLPDDELRHIGMLGAIGPEKGARRVETLVARIRERRLPLRIVVIGYTDRESRHQSSDLVLSIHGRYKFNEIEPLLDHYRIALVAFPTEWPETFSYTLGEAWMAGRAALVPPRGALQERVLAKGAGWIMDGWPDPDAILDQFMALTAPENAAELQRRGQLAKNAAAEDARQAGTIGMLYSDALADITRRANPVIDRYRIYEAACRALRVKPLPPVANRIPAAPAQRPGALGRLLRLLRG